MGFIAFAGATHEFTVYGYNAFDLTANLFDPIAENQFKEIGLDNTEETIKSIMAGNGFKVGDFAFKEIQFGVSEFFYLIPRLCSTNHCRNGNIDDSFHFMDLSTIHSRIFYLLTNVNYAYFHVNLLCADKDPLTHEKNRPLTRRGLL